MTKNVIRFFILFLFVQYSFAQDLGKSNQIHSDQIVLYVSNQEIKMPNSILKSLEKVPEAEFTDGLIYDLILTGKFRNILVKEFINTKSKKKMFLVTADYARKVQNIIIDGINANDQVLYIKGLHLQSGKLFKKYLISKDINKILYNLRTKGYPNAIVAKYRIIEVSNMLVNIKYYLEKKQPCRIDQVNIENYNANILNFINIPIETGSICDINQINDKLEVMKNNFLREGYLNARCELKEIIYSQNNEQAKISLTIEKGNRTTFQVKDENKNFITSDFLNLEQTAIGYSDLLISSDSDLRNSLINYYQSLGFPYVEVSGPTRIVDTNNDTKVIFTVNRKKKVTIGDIFFIGDLPEDKESVLKELGFKKNFWDFNDIPFVQNELYIYKDKLRNIYYRDGYQEAQVSLPDFTFVNNGNKVNLIFNIIPGDKFIFSGVEFENLPNEIRIKSKKLAKIINSGDVINFDNQETYANEINSEIKDYGYLYSKLKVIKDLKQTTSGIKYVTLRIIIDPGPIVYIGKVYAQGDLFGKKREIISISGLEEGERFTQKLLDLGRTRLLRHDLFSSVNIEPLDFSALERNEDILDVVIRTKGKSGYILTLSPGYGITKGYSFKTGYTLNNITEHGLKLISSAGVSQELQQISFGSSETKQILGQQLNLGLSEPLFKFINFSTPLDLTGSVGYQVVAETLSNRRYITSQLSTDWKPTYFENKWTLNTSFKYEHSKSTSSESNIVQTIDSADITVNELLNTLTLDNRNNQAWPTAGGLYSFGYGISRFGFGSEVQFDRILPRANFYFPIFGKLSGAIMVGGTFVFNTFNKNGETVAPPASRRTTLNSEESANRGFPETYGAAAPGPLLWMHYDPAKSSGSFCDTQLASVGATNLIYLKSELRYRFSDNWGGVFFIDSGESFFTLDEAKQVNDHIKSQIALSSKSAPIKGQCFVDSAVLLQPNVPEFKGIDIIQAYWKQAYVSAGFGVRYILGNIASVSLDYGYPLKDPAQNQQDCVDPAMAVKLDHVPTCISRIQSSDWNFISKKAEWKFKGAIRFGIGATF